jgi:hypothetical protein
VVRGLGYLCCGHRGRLATPPEPARREHEYPKQEGEPLSQCPTNCCGGEPTPRQYAHEGKHQGGVRPVHEDIRCDPVARDEQLVDEIGSPGEQRAQCKDPQAAGRRHRVTRAEEAEHEGRGRDHDNYCR